MTYDDLDELYGLGLHEPRERLRELLKNTLNERAGHPDDLDDVCRELSEYCGYTRPTVVGLWLDGRTAIPIDKLIPIAEYTFLPLSMLVPLWIARYAPEEQAERLYRAVEPRAADSEVVLLKLARSVYMRMFVPVEDSDGSAPT